MTKEAAPSQFDDACSNKLLFVFIRDKLINLKAKNSESAARAKRLKS